jgi:hypothetical protein
MVSIIRSLTSLLSGDGNGIHIPNDFGVCTVLDTGKNAKMTGNVHIDVKLSRVR